VVDVARGGLTLIELGASGDARRILLDDSERS
jgi:hypothetical protein